MSDEGTLVYEEEKKVLEWFSDFLKDASASFSTSTFYFDKYFRKCCNDLFNLKYKREKKSDIVDGRLDAIYIEDMQDFKNRSSYSLVLTELHNRSEFLEEAILNGLISREAGEAIKVLSSGSLKKLTKEEVEILLNDKDFLTYYNEGKLEEEVNRRRTSEEVVEDSLVPLLKLHRLNNLQVKYAHTARIVYLTDFEVKRLGVEDELVKSILYSSALFHDVGRFYQGTYYNSYDEGDLRKSELFQVRDHAEAGYYYSLLDMINLNVLGSASNEDLIIHALAAVVVKKHQLPNAGLGNYDKMISNFEFNSNIQKNLLDFVLDCYGEAEKFDGGLHGRFSKKDAGSAEVMRQSFTDGMLNIISAYTGEENLDSIRDVVYGMFTYETPNLVLSGENIIVLRSILQGEERLELERRIMNGETILLSPEYNRALRNYQLSKLLENRKIESAKVGEFINGLMRSSEDPGYYSQYDIVSVIDKVMDAEAKGEDYRGITFHPDVLKVIRMSMGIVMDADKLDILVQRAIKRYPAWNPNMIVVKALKENDEASVTKDESILDVLKNQFQIDVRYNENGQLILDDVLVSAIKCNINTNDNFRRKFGDNFDVSSITSGVVDREIEAVLEESYNGGRVSVPYEVMAQAHPDLMERYQIEMDLILPKDLRENVFKVDEERRKAQGNNGAVTAFPLGENSTDARNFVWGNAFPGFWWQLDQFVMTNMRSMESLRFIRETGLLERIGDTYKSEDCPEEFSLFVDEIIDFTEEFIDLASIAKVNRDGNIIFLEDDVSGYAPVVLSDQETMLAIRNEAAIRHREKNMEVQNDRRNDEVSSIELARMFEEGVVTGANALSNNTTKK